MEDSIRLIATKMLVQGNINKSAEVPKVGVEWSEICLQSYLIGSSSGKARVYS